MRQHQPTPPEQAAGDYTAWLKDPADYREELEEIRRAQLLVKLEQLKVRSRRA